MKCLKCGREMVSTTGGNENCPRCGFAVNDLVLRPSNCDMPMPEGFGKSTGWICPVCGRGLAPWTSFCPCRGSGSEITYGGTQVGSGNVTYLNSDGGFQSTATSIDSELERLFKLNDERVSEMIAFYEDRANMESNE